MTTQPFHSRDRQPVRSASTRWALIIFSVAAALAVRGQTPAAPPAAPKHDEIVTLSAFQVSTTYDKGYRAGNSVSATRTDTAIKDLPFSINAFTEQFIADVDARDLFDVVQYAPSVTSAGREFTAGNAVFTIRGFDQKPQHNGFVGDAYVDTSSVERIEVVKGPSSVLYGQVAPGGTVNYITKRAQPKAFTTVTGQVGNLEAWRTTIDLNQPLAGEKLLFRFNGALEGLAKNVDPYKGRSWVIAPNLVWKITDRASLSVDYQWFRRTETPPSQLAPNIEIVALPPASGLLATGGVLVKPDNSDYGFGTYFPLARDFNYVSRNDSRTADFENINAELSVKFSDQWVGRANLNWSKTRSWHKLTGLGAVSITVPPRFYPAGVALPISAANYLIAAQGFADAVLANTNVALEAPLAQLSRRKRLQEDYVPHANAMQVEFAGKYDLSGGAKLRPLVGYFYNESVSVGRIRQSGAAAFPNFPVWNIKDPSTWDFNTDFDPVTLPLTTSTHSVTTNSAGYAVLNGTFWDGTLFTVVGARYSVATGLTDNYLAPATSVPKRSNTKTTPQFGLGWKPQRDLMLYASYSESFVLNAADLVFQNVPTGPAAPTTSKGYEIGVKTDFLAGRVSSTVAFYQIDQRDRILRFNGFNATGVTVTNNLQGTLDRSNGVEAEITWSPMDNWQVYASGALDDLRVKKVPVGEEIFLGTHPEASVKALFNLWTRYSFKDGGLKGLWLGAGFNHTGDKAQRVNNPRLFLPADTLFNGALGYDWKWDGHRMTTTLNVQNITDQNYYPANQQRGYPRRISLSFTARY